VTIDYDVVVIGGSLAGRYAALTASQLRAKVALVEPTTNGGFNVNAPYEFISHHALSHISNLGKQLGDAAEIGLHTSCADTKEKCQISAHAAQAMLYAHGVVSNLQEQHSPAVIAAQGVDVILGNGQFESSSIFHLRLMIACYVHAAICLLRVRVRQFQRLKDYKELAF
jgi:pyruvate/2-oxoglutarate dehydrogenase complex dihydrolipoamide dehydrogenase (E3) component